MTPDPTDEWGEAVDYVRMNGMAETPESESDSDEEKDSIEEYARGIFATKVVRCSAISSAVWLKPAPQPMKI